MARFSFSFFSLLVLLFNFYKASLSNIWLQQLRPTVPSFFSVTLSSLYLCICFVFLTNSRQSLPFSAHVCTTSVPPPSSSAAKTLLASLMSSFLVSVTCHFTDSIQYLFFPPSKKVVLLYHYGITRLKRPRRFC